MGDDWEEDDSGSSKPNGFGSSGGFGVQGSTGFGRGSSGFANVGRGYTAGGFGTESGQSSGFGRGRGGGGGGGFGGGGGGFGGGGGGFGNKDSGSTGEWSSGGGGGFGGGFGQSGGGFNDEDSGGFGSQGGSSSAFGSGGSGGRGRGRGSNSGNSSGCRRCGEDGHFARDCPNKPAGGGGACHKCGQEGHFARDCPNPSANDRGPRTCRTCGEEGHISRNCPSGGGSQGFEGGFGSGFGAGSSERTSGSGFGSREEKSSSGFGGGFGGKSMGGSNSRSTGGFGGGGFGGGDDDAGGGGGGGKSDGCRKCGESGHFARECPNAPKRDTNCRNCGEEGHFAKDCTKEKVLDPSRPPPVTYIPPEPSEEEVAMFRTIEQGINFDKYDNIPVQVTGHGDIPKPVRAFEEAGLHDQVLENVKRAKYQKPTPVQKYAIPIVLAERDLMSCAQTGSGKTAAFLLPVLTVMSRYQGELTSRLSEVQAPLALVIAPTRELACQIYNDARSFSSGTVFRPVVVYGGVSVAHQLNNIGGGCNLLIGTPGRLKDFLGKRKISLSKLKFLILDEADRMLDMGFMPDVTEIVNGFDMPRKTERRTLMFSATFPEEIQKLAAEFLNDYIFLTIGKVGGTSADIEQVVEDVPDSQKRDRLVEILNEQGVNRNLVFVQSKRAADFLASFLSQNGFPTTSIHGDRYQQQREEALLDFRRGTCSVLIATAVAARGLDIAGVKQVINYDLPSEIDEYVHRIGRTGRIGNKGRAVSFFSRDQDVQLARALVKVLAEAEQVVPDWLEEIAATALGTGYGPKGGKYGAMDSRRTNADSNFKVSSYNAVGTEDGWDTRPSGGSRREESNFSGGGFGGAGFGGGKAVNGAAGGGGDDEWE